MRPYQLDGHALCPLAGHKQGRNGTVARVVAALAAIDDGRVNAGTESVKGIPQITSGPLARIEAMAERLSGKLRGEAHRLKLAATCLIFNDLSPIHLR